MAGRHKLTDALVQRLTSAANTQRDYFDALVPGLVLRVGQRTKTWAVRGDLAGKRRRFNIGVYPTTRVYEAREKALEFLRKIGAGIDPTADQIPTGEATFQSVLDSFEARALPKMGARTRDEWKRLLKTEVRPRLETVDLTDTRAARKRLRLALEEIAGERPVLANRVHTLVVRVIRWAVEQDILPPERVAVVTNLPKPTKEESRDRVLNATELRSFLEALREEPAALSTYWRLLLLTGQRRSEVLAMRFDEVDLEAATWTLTVKGSKPHLLPLSKQAVELVKAARTLQGGPYVIEGESIDRPLANVQRSAQRIRTRARLLDFRGHDLRRTVASGMGTMGIDPAIVSRVLGHATLGPGVAPVTKVYLRASYLEGMRQALQAWADRVDGLSNSAG